MTKTRLTQGERAKIIEFFTQHPDGGYKSACRAAGIQQLTKAEARALIEADPDLSEHRERNLGIDEDSAWKRVATIAKDTEHKDSLRANTFILAAIHGRSETARLELTGGDGGPIEVADRSASLAHVASILNQVGALEASDDGSGTPRLALPAPPTVLAEPEEG